MNTHMQQAVCLKFVDQEKNGSTVESLLTHTPWDRPDTMGYQGVWVLREFEIGYVLPTGTIFFTK